MSGCPAEIKHDDWPPIYRLPKDLIARLMAPWIVRRCGTCGHFQPLATNPSIGRCGIGCPPSAACGFFWGSDMRPCKEWSQNA